MRSTMGLSILLSLSIYGCAGATPATSTVGIEKRATVGEAQAAAAQWFVLVDAGNYEQSWDEGASLLKQGITRSQWKGALDSVRAPLGAVTNRQLRNVRYSTSLPGSPTGEYAVLEYRTAFGGASATETLTMSKESDGIWRAAGYFVR